MAQFMTSELLWLFIAENIFVLSAWFLYRDIVRIPKQYRTVPTFLPWLLCIPIGNLVVCWVIAWGLPNSFRNYYSKNPITWKKPHKNDGNRFGRNKGLVFAISLTAFLIPGIWLVAACVAFLSLVSFLIHMWRLASMIPLIASNEFTTSPASSVPS